MSNIITNYIRLPFNQITIQDALNTIKTDIENAILNFGEKGKSALIRSQRPIKLIHDAVKSDLLLNGVHPSLINPGIRRLIMNARASSSNRLIRRQTVLRDKELNLAGLLKTKKQDISIVPGNIMIAPETLLFPTLLHRFLDPFGSEFTESVLTINVRSQLSSADKNFDTLYERTFAESLNLHSRFSNMVIGEVYMIIAKGYDSEAAKNKTVGFRDTEDIEKYIKAFQAINQRQNVSDALYKYERASLLIVDFSQITPKLYNTTAELKTDGLIPSNSPMKLEPLSYATFIGELLQVYQLRFPTNSFS